MKTILYAVVNTYQQLRLLCDPAIEGNPYGKSIMPLERTKTVGKRIGGFLRKRIVF